MSDFAPVATPSPAPSVSGAPAAPAATPTPAPAVATPAIPQVATPQVPATPVQTPQVEPSWLKGRLEETRQSALRQASEYFGQREAEYQARVQQMENQLRALVGAAPPANPEVDAVRQQFSQLYPGLTKMEDRAEQLLSVLERAGDLESQTNHYWQSYGRQTMSRLFEKATESYGAPLSDEGKRQLHAAFTGYVSSSPELTARYANDPSLVDEFWNSFTSSFVTPARRVTAANTIERTGTPLPHDAPGGSPQVTPVAKPGTMDDRGAAAWLQYQATKRQ
jgi:hypothetical protein